MVVSEHPLLEELPELPDSVQEVGRCRLNPGRPRARRAWFQLANS
jgi:hypothetical protein